MVGASRGLFDSRIDLETGCDASGVSACDATTSSFAWETPADVLVVAVANSFLY